MLSFYAMQLISVKILLDSDNHTIRDGRARKHQRFGFIFVTLISFCLLGNSLAASLSSARWESFSFMIYRLSTLLMLARLAFALPFFLERRPDSSVKLWVYTLLFANFAIQLSTLIRPLVIFLSTFGLFTYSA